MSGAEQRAYAMSPGAYEYQEDPGLPQRALALLDQRDAEHYQRYGHLPGTAAGCSERSRAEALPSAMVAARTGRRDGFPGGTTAELVEWWNRRQPWANVAITGPDPELAAARGDLAQKMAQLHAGTVP